MRHERNGMARSRLFPSGTARRAPAWQEAVAPRLTPWQLLLELAHFSAGEAAAVRDRVFGERPS